nr:putative transporter [Quercus suber]
MLRFLPKVGYVADRTRARGWCNVGTSLFSIVGFTMLLASTNSAVKYAGVFLAMIGVFPLPANIITWAANNIEGVYKRGISFGFIIGIGQINGIVSSAIYPTSDAPQYYPGNGVCLAYIVVFLLGGSLVTHFLLEAENKKRRAGKRDHWIEGKSPEEIKFMGDQVQREATSRTTVCKDTAQHIDRAVNISELSGSVRCHDVAFNSWNCPAFSGFLDTLPP